MTTHDLHARALEYLKAHPHRYPQRPSSLAIVYHELCRTGFDEDGYAIMDRGLANRTWREHGRHLTLSALEKQMESPQQREKPHEQSP